MLFELEQLLLCPITFLLYILYMYIYNYTFLDSPVMSLHFSPYSAMCQCKIQSSVQCSWYVINSNITNSSIAQNNISRTWDVVIPWNICIYNCWCWQFAIWICLIMLSMSSLEEKEVCMYSGICNLFGLIFYFTCVEMPFTLSLSRRNYAGINFAYR